MPCLTNEISLSRKPLRADCRQTRDWESGLDSSRFPRYLIFSFFNFFSDVFSVTSVVKSRLCFTASAIIPAHGSSPAPPGNPRRLRAPFLGRQHQRNLRASLLLRRLLLPGHLSSGKAQLLPRADRDAHRHFRRNGLVPSDLWRRAGG